MKRMAAGTFKTHCLAVIKEVESTGEPVTVTLRGTPIVRVVPVEAEDDSIFGFMRGKAKIVGDIESPIPLEDWKIFKK